MKKVLSQLIFAILFSVFNNGLAQSEELSEIKIEHTDIFMETLEELVNDNETPMQGSAIMNKEPVLKTDITVIDINKPLLKDKLHFEFEHGPFEDMTIYGSYRGDFSFNILNHGYNTLFQNGFAEGGIYGKFRELPVDYRFSLNFRPIEGFNYLGTMIQDNFITINAVPHHKIYLGHMRTPIGIEGGKSSYVTPFLMRSQISRNFGNVRALGLKVIGDYPLVDYNLGVYSSDRYFEDFFPGAEFTGWLNIKPLGKTDGKFGKLVLGGGLNTGHRDNSYLVGGLYAGYEYKKFNFDFEYSAANGYNGIVTHSPNKAQGFYASAAYKITDKLQVLARYDQFIPNIDKSHNPQKEYTAGLNYFIKGHALKIMLNYVYYENFERNNGSRIFVGTQVLL